MLPLQLPLHFASNYCCKYGFMNVTGQFLLRVITLTRDIDIAILSVRPSVRPSVCPSVRNVQVSDENGLTYCHSFSPYYAQSF